MRRLNYPFSCTDIVWLQICLSGLVKYLFQKMQTTIFATIHDKQLSQLQLFPQNIYYGFIYQLSLIVFWDFNLNDHFNPPDVPEILLRWASGASSTSGFLKLKPPELCLLITTLLHHNHCCLWEGVTVRSPSVTWPLLFPWQPGVPLWIGQSLQWRLCPCPASGRSAAPPAGPSVACGPMLIGEALWGPAVRRLSPGTPSWRRSACTQGATTAAAASAWSSLFWETIAGQVFPSWNLPKSLHQPKRHSHAALRQWWQDGNLIPRVLPKPGRKNRMKMEENQQSRIFQH